MKKVIERITSGPGHWVGDGFPVRSLFSYSSHPKTLSPFLLLSVSTRTVALRRSPSCMGAKSLTGTASAMGASLARVMCSG